jgi:rhodanese-related sulfurtransferase
MTPQECFDRLQRSERLTLIDVRTPGEFEAIHAAPARLVPLDRLPGTDLQGALALICKSGARAARARDALAAAGRADVVVVEGGTDAWAAAGLPCVRGRARVPSLERQVRIAAGLLVSIGVILGYLVHPGFLVLSLFVGCGLIFAGVTDTCGMAMLLAKLPWNRGGTACGI